MIGQGSGVKAVRSLPLFGTVGFRERSVRPVPVEDAVGILVAALEGRIPDHAVAVMGAEELELGVAARRIARLAGGRALFVPLPLWTIRIVAVISEALMVVPLVAKSQAKMLGEGVSEALPFAPETPIGIRPAHGFDEDRIRAALPTGRFTLNDLRLARNLQKRAATIDPCPSTPFLFSTSLSSTPVPIRRKRSEPSCAM